jgi:hypothetical protein
LGSGVAVHLYAAQYHVTALGVVMCLPPIG